MKRLALILLLPLAFACKTQKDTAEAAIKDTTSKEQPSENNGSISISSNTEEAQENTEESNTKPEKPFRTKATLGDNRKESDYLKIIDAEIEGVLLFLTVEYSGGCARHNFELIGSKAISKSFPPQRAVKLIHDNGDDICEAVVTRKIEVDISELAYQQTKGSEIILNLDGYDKRLKFIFP